jgi:hypothetical protein
MMALGLLRGLPLAPAIDDPCNAAADDRLS